MTTLVLSTPIGRLRLEAKNGVLTAIERTKSAGPTKTDDPLLRRAAEQIEEYFAGARMTFDLPLAAADTPFQAAVRRALQKIPFGQTTTYGNVAADVGTKSARAVGQAVGANPFAVVVPCHRVVATGGGLGGYAWGLPTKERLLSLENR